MIVLRTPKGWTGPKVVDGLPVEGTWRAHQVPLAATRENPEHLAQLERWMQSYRPEELFDDEVAPVGGRPLAARSATAHGLEPARQRRPLLRDLDLPDFRDFGVNVPAPGGSTARRRACSASICATSFSQRRRTQLPALRTRRDRVEPPWRGARGDRQGVGWATLPLDEGSPPTGA